MTTSGNKNFKLPILAKANHRQWFNQAKTSLEAQDIEYVLESDTPDRTPFAAPQSNIDQQAKQFKKDNKTMSKKNRQRAYIADSDLSDTQEHATIAVAEPRSDVDLKNVDYCFSSIENKWIPIRKGGLQRLDVDPHETNDNKWFRISPPC